MADGIVADQTRSASVTDAPVRVTKTRTIDELVEDVGYLRNVGRVLGQDVADTNRQVSELHHQAIVAQLDTRARQVAKQGMEAVLADLAESGFAWRDIARLVGVSVPAVRRWRQGEQSTGQNLLAASRLLAFVQILEADHLISNAASWLEMPLTSAAPVNGLDLVADGLYHDLLDVAANQKSSEEVLDAWQPDWRARYASDFEVFTAADGEMGIRAVRAEE